MVRPWKCCYAPPSDVRNVSAFFVSYASKAGERERRKRPALTPIGAAPARTGSDTGLPKPPGLELAAQAELLTADEFIQKYSLDDSSRKLLEGLDDATSKTVLGGFKPGEGTSDMNKRFSSYVQSVRDGGGMKTSAVGSPGGKGEGGTKSGGKGAGKAKGKSSGKGSGKSRGDEYGDSKGKGGAIGGGAKGQGKKSAAKPSRPPLRAQPVGGKGKS